MKNFLLVAVLGLSALALTACGNVGTGGSHSLSGTVYGGQQPVTGSTVTLYAVGSTTPLGTATTDSTGHWSIASFSCALVGSTTNIYAVASGGNPGLPGSVDNTALKLISLMGPCGDESGTFLPHSVNVNEITTVATVYALNGFIATLPDDIHASASNSLGLIRAEQTVKQLADVATGEDGPAFAGGANAATAQKLNSLANSLAACVNTASGTSAACTELFACARPGASYSAGTCTGGTGTPAANTLQAILDIARNPGLVSRAGVYNVATTKPVFPPRLTAAPTDETLMLNFTGGGLNYPLGVAIDAAGNVWIASNGNNTVNEFSPLGVPKSLTGYTGGGLSHPWGIAIDPSGKVWTESANNTVNEFSASGTAISPSTGYTGGGLNVPQSIAIDASGKVWTASKGNNTVNEFNSSGTALSGNGYTGGGLNTPLGIAIDASGKVWTTSINNSTVNEFDASGAALSGGGYTGGGLNGPWGIAIDPSGNVWAASLHNKSVSEFNSSGTALSGVGGYTDGGLANSYGIAIDAAGHVWVANFGRNAVSEFNSSGTARSPSSGYTGGGLDASRFIAIDASGNVWITNSFGNSLTELIGAAAPTRTPLVATLTQGFAP